MTTTATRWGPAQLPQPALPLAQLPDRPPRTMLLIVPCGAKKLRHAAPAAQLYTGSLFVSALRAARAVGGAAELAGWHAEVRILSALHGLVALDTELAPYNVRTGDPAAITGDELRRLEADRRRPVAVAVLGGRQYVALARQVWPLLVAPLEGLAGIGYMRQRLAQLAADPGELLEQLAAAALAAAIAGEWDR